MVVSVVRTAVLDPSLIANGLLAASAEGTMGMIPVKTLMNIRKKWSEA